MSKAGQKLNVSAVRGAGNNARPGPSKKAKLEEGHWRKSSSNLGSIFKTMFEKKILTDLIIKVGSGGVRKRNVIECHSIVLMGCSPVFETMMSDRWSVGDSSRTHNSKMKITLLEDDPKHFNEFIMMIYADWKEKDALFYRTVSPDVAVGVLVLAEKYLVHSVVRHLENYLYWLLRDDETEELVQLYVLLSRHPVCGSGQNGKRFLRTVQICISQMAEHIFLSDNIVELNQAELASLLALWYLKCPEDIVYNGCVRWAIQKCLQMKLDPVGENLRSVLQDAIYLIRFPLIDNYMLTEQVIFSNILTAEECKELLSYKLNSECTHLNFRFPTEERISKDTFIVKRFGDETGAKHMMDFSTFHGFEMTVSKEIELCNLWFYGGESEDATFTCAVEFEYTRSDEPEPVVQSQKINYVKTQPSGVLSLKLSPYVRIPMNIPVDVKFKVSTELNDARTYIATENVDDETQEISLCKNDPIIFTFKKNSLPSGLKQIPQIDFSLREAKTNRHSWFRNNTTPSIVSELSEYDVDDDDMF